VLRVNLNRTLTPYPAPDPLTDIITNTVQFQQAQNDRVNFARDIYNALVRVTGAQDPNTANPAAVPGSPDYLAARWLAQFAVNIVDYIDSDDIITAFNWFPAAPGIDGWVFGTELSRLVLNEVYAQVDNDPNATNTAAMTATSSKINVYAELHNPFKATPATDNYPNDAGIAKLTIGGGAYSNYQILFYQSTPALSVNIRDAINNPTYNLGLPDATVFQPKGTFNTWGTSATTQVVLPSGGAFNGTTISAAIASATEAGNLVTVNTAPNPHGFVAGQTVVISGAPAGYNGSFPIVGTPTATTFTYNCPTGGLAPAAAGGSATVGGNSGFFVVGPTATYLPSRDPNLPTTFSSTALSFAWNPDNNPAFGPVTLLLQRLAIPHLPPQNNPALPLYNPYITVDYFDAVAAADNRLYNSTGMLTPPATNAFNSFGRKQPYGGQASQYVAQIPGISAANQPINTFFSHNGLTAATLDTPFTWLTHLDRPLVNQLELLHVSGYKPHELTQQFIMPGGKFQHYAPWADPASGLYRVLDLLGTPNNLLGTYRGGRWPGNVNLNTITELEVFMALCDPQNATQPYSAFSQADVQTVLTKIIQNRTGNPLANYAPGGLPMAISEGAPFKSYAAASINDTFFRPDAAGPIFMPPSSVTAHPYVKSALLQKIFNNITTTSNVFGVWWTVGYFEVVDESVRPARLGQEIGRNENRHIRHRFFAIVDRSGMQLFNTTSTKAVTGTTSPWNPAQLYAPGNVVVFNGTNYVCIQANTGNAPTNAAFWSNAVAPAAMFFNPVSGTTSGGVPVALQPGMLVEIDAGTVNAEVVAVTSVAGNSFTGNFTMPHAAGVKIVCRGNPGPQANYNPRHDTGVVLHLTVIQ
jgi:hypothetical protein